MPRLVAVGACRFRYSLIDGLATKDDRRIIAFPAHGMWRTYGRRLWSVDRHFRSFRKGPSPDGRGHPIGGTVTRTGQRTGQAPSVAIDPNRTHSPWPDLATEAVPSVGPERPRPRR